MCADRPKASFLVELGGKLTVMPAAPSSDRILYFSRRTKTIKIEHFFSKVRLKRSMYAFSIGVPGRVKWSRYLLLNTPIAKRLRNKFRAVICAQASWVAILSAADSSAQAAALSRDRGIHWSRGCSSLISTLQDVVRASWRSQLVRMTAGAPFWFDAKFRRKSQ